MKEVKECCIKLLSKLLTPATLDWNLNNNWFCTCGHDLRWLRDILVDVGYKPKDEEMLDRGVGIPHLTSWKEQFIWLNEAHQRLKSQLADQEEDIENLEKGNERMQLLNKELKQKLAIKYTELEGKNKDIDSLIDVGLITQKAYFSLWDDFDELRSKIEELEKVNKKLWSDLAKFWVKDGIEKGRIGYLKTDIKKFELSEEAKEDLARIKKELNLPDFADKIRCVSPPIDWQKLYNELRSKIKDLEWDIEQYRKFQESNPFVRGMKWKDRQWHKKINNLDEMGIKKRVFFESYLKEWYKDHNIPEDLQIYISDLINTNIHHTIKVTKKLLGDKMKKRDFIFSTAGNVRCGMSFLPLHMPSQREGWFEFLKSIEWGVTASCNAKWKGRIKRLRKKYYDDWEYLDMTGIKPMVSVDVIFDELLDCSEKDATDKTAKTTGDVRGKEHQNIHSVGCPSAKPSGKNPMHYCFNDCGKYLGFRGWCSVKCHNEYFDRKYGSSKSEEKIIWCNCGDSTKNKDGVCDTCKLTDAKPSGSIEKWTVRRIYDNFIPHHQAHPSLGEDEEFVKVDDLQKMVDEIKTWEQYFDVMGWKEGRKCFKETIKLFEERIFESKKG